MPPHDKSTIVQLDLYEAARQAEAIDLQVRGIASVVERAKRTIGEYLGSQVKEIEESVRAILRGRRPFGCRPDGRRQIGF